MSYVLFLFCMVYWFTFMESNSAIFIDASFSMGVNFQAQKMPASAKSFLNEKTYPFLSPDVGGGRL